MPPQIIGILSPGEMGSQIGARLVDAGFRVLSVGAERSVVTQRRARAAGMELLDDWESLLRQTDLILSVVPPAAAKPVAQKVASFLTSTGKHPFYVDANAIAPQSSMEIGEILRVSKARYLDGSIIGNAAGWEHHTRIYLSGPQAEPVRDCLAVALRVEVLGPDVGQASALKILYAGLTKGLSALGMELLAGAEQLGITAKLLQTYGETFPDIVDFFHTTLTGLPERAERRSQEMVELAAMQNRLGLAPQMSPAAAAALHLLARRQAETPPPPEPRNLEQLLQWWIKAQPQQTREPGNSIPPIADD